VSRETFFAGKFGVGVYGAFTCGLHFSQQYLSLLLDRLRRCRIGGIFRLSKVRREDVYLIE
jgi:hypothetical protein